ncbi:MAG: PEP-CTERM sorting domain-containing protein [Proteobacteria bacterium]|nr:MAG: PEP-CTERM sorting domain-containing protein [Pseudomonadota bacterium]QKK11549.1 MAG: PEP-CTERM sorting domain-containing protein [Pseudomonadota bacterium]
MNIGKALFAVVATTLLLFGTPARALVLNPGDMIPGHSFGPRNCEPGCIYDAFGLASDPSLALLYKAEWGFDRELEIPLVREEGSFAGWYSTTFSNTARDPSNALIEQEGAGNINCPECYLAVKDGNASPGYYFYNLASWDGMEDIRLENFWPNQGAISHVSIWGRNATSVSEPTPLTLMGISLLVMGIVMKGRRRV